jgi:type I restriction enzyme S subunit
MLKTKTYVCEICKTRPDQISHHKMHLETQKHKDKKELFELKLSKLSNSELEKLYYTTDINIIVSENETNVYVPVDEKKLKDTCDTFDTELSININTEMSSEDKQKLVKSQNVSNKEALKDKIHEIHNLLRNNGAGYGMNALKVFNIIYGLKKIEEKKLLDVVKLKRPDCEFSYLLKLANENKDEELAELIFGDVLDSIAENIRDLLFYEIPKKIKGSVLSQLVKEINKITIIEQTCNVLLSGKIYEYFIGRDETAISELGAYFTDRHIVDYIFQKLDPEINEDGSIDSMIDMFGGSGGFTTGYINYLNSKYDNIDWKKNINQIYHFDMNEDVIKSAGLEIFCLTGVLPDMENNLGYRNSFVDEFDEKKKKLVITNPPYGGDKNTTSDAQIKRTKLIDYIKKELLTLKDESKIKSRTRQLKKIEDEEKQEKKEIEKTRVSRKMCSNRINRFATKYNDLKGNDKESCSLILLMDMVDDDGTVIGVLKEGVFFNKTYKDIRKCLIENFNVREIISIPQDQFENTSTKTSIVIFDNTKTKTSKVKFSELVVQKYTEDKFEEIGGEIVLVESKDDISGVSDRLISEATKEEILKNPIHSLNGKDYNKKTIVCGKDYELKKLGEICEFLQKSKRKASDGKSEGKYNFYTSSDKVQKCDFIDYNDECIIIGSGGIANIKMDKNFSCSGDNFIITSKYNQYIFNFLKGNISLLSDGFTGSTLKHISKNYLENLQIPIPKSETKIKEWIDKISKPYDTKNKCEQKIKQLEAEIKEQIKEISEKEDCEEVELGSICEFKAGKFNTCNMDNKGLYPFYNATVNSIGFHSEYCFDDPKYILLIKSGNVHANGLGSVIKVKGKTACVSDMVQIKSTMNIDYIYVILELIKDKIRTTSNNSVGLGHLKISEVKKLKIKIPKNKKLIDSLDPKFKEIEKLQSESKEAELEYKKLIKTLSDEAMPATLDKNLQTTSEATSETTSETTLKSDTKEHLENSEKPSEKNIESETTSKKLRKTKTKKDDIPLSEEMDIDEAVSISLTRKSPKKVKAK